ncbi:MAG: hypothetical protein EBV06_02915 [Planctomycetia bacterium]|nr:hypothetical protein [Planctomycetia bacterium]
MNRLLGLALIGLTLCTASRASAAGWPPSGGGWGTVPGYVNFKFNARLEWGPFGWGHGAYPGGDAPVQPYQLGPWYQYWPYEAHFQTPAIQMYPYWGAMTLPHGSPVINPGYPGHGAIPNYWQLDQK